MLRQSDVDFVELKTVAGARANMVEAGGVEPPSEKARREENYVRIRLMNFGGRLRTGESGGNLVRLVFSRTAPDRSFWPIPQDDAHSPPRGLSGWSGHLIN